MLHNNLTIKNLLNKFSTDHTNISWNMKCLYCDGSGTTINQIKIYSNPNNHNIGIFSYCVETGRVKFSMYKTLEKCKSANIIDALLDMMNYSKKIKQ